MKNIMKIILCTVMLLSVTIGFNNSTEVEAASYPELATVQKLLTATTNKITTMYSAPDTKSNVVTTISKGKFVTIKKSNANWYYVVYGKDIVGYISTKTVDLHSSTIKKNLGYSIFYKPTKVYSSPSVNASYEIYIGMNYPKVEYETMDGKWIAITDGKKDYYVLKSDANVKKIKGKTTQKENGKCLSKTFSTCTVYYDSKDAASLKIELEALLVTAIYKKAINSMSTTAAEAAIKNITQLDNSALKKIIIKQSGKKVIPLLGAIQNVTAALVDYDDYRNKFTAYLSAPVYIKLRSVNYDNGVKITFIGGVLTNITSQ